MSYSDNTNRWWENYLVRYFMPSIAGMAIVAWLTSISGEDTKTLLFFHILGNSHDTTSLILLVLYGNLFCYISSYPILGFHATRVIDFQNASWRPHVLDGYILSAVTAFATFLVIWFCPICARAFCAFVIVSLFSVAQTIRFLSALKKRDIKGLKEPTSLAYGYAFKLAKRRGISEETSETSTASDVDEDETPESTKQSKAIFWRREIIDSYRHLREHGNSAFIFVLEIILSALCYLIFSVDGLSSEAKLADVGILLGIWALPAILSHLLGQILERRFSLFDRALTKVTSDE